MTLDELEKELEKEFEMNIDDMKIGDAKAIAAMFGGQANVRLNQTIAHGKHIVILQRGWVVVGDLFSNGSKYWIDNGSVIRLWGTVEGLGELAIKGKLPNTKLDKLTDGTWFHELTIVGAIPCSKRWD